MSSGRGRQKYCTVCRTQRAAFSTVEYCFTCWPGGPFQPLPCLRCGSRTQYFVNGLCHRCHIDGHPGVDSCRNCLAWGATRHLKWWCKACHSWCREYTVSGPCGICGHPGVLDDDRVCRLCRRQAAMLRPGDRTLTVTEAAKYGHQLFFADMFIARGQHRPAKDKPAPVQSAPLGLPPWRQLRLFDMPRDLSWRGYRTGGLAERADPALTAAVDPVVREHAARYGWSKATTWEVRTGVRVLLGLIDGPGVVITATDAAVLAGTELPVGKSLDVLAEARMIEDDRIPAIEAWFACQAAGLPEPMAGELERWFAIMLHGTRTPPRRRARAQVTARLHLTWAMPALRAWAGAGFTSLREVTAADIRAVLPPSGNPRSTLGAGLRSVLTVLKQQKVIFTNPIASIRTGYHEPRQPLPADLALVREALQSPDPARAAVVALAAFHGLRAGQVRELRLTDLHDGRLHLRDHIVLLAGPARVRLTAWLDYRARHWPGTANPHLFITRRTATGLGPAGLRWIKLKTGIPGGVQAIREDRILHEAHASGGDLRRLCDLFGLSVSAAERYTSTLDHPDFITRAAGETAGT
jgi:integrase